MKVVEGLPPGVNSLRELVGNYLTIDSKLTVRELIDRIKADHGLDPKHNSIESSRYHFLRSRGIMSPVNHKPKPPNASALIREMLKEEPKLSINEIRMKLASRGFEVGESIARKTRHLFFKKKGVVSPISRVGNTPTGTVSVKALEQFKEAVNGIGGPKVASAILSLF